MNAVAPVVSRRALLRSGAAGAGALALGAALSTATLAQPGGTVRTIAITAKRFAYIPDEIALKLGEKVVLAVTSLDFMHGMNIPDLGVRVDLVPGRTTHMEIEPKQAGVIEFVCDNFCGDHHEEMFGRLVVSA